eukprot:scaffold24150_cov21-Prasinocladus_malaysianus.AAC.1
MSCLWLPSVTPCPYVGCLSGLPWKRTPHETTKHISLKRICLVCSWIEKLEGTMAAAMASLTGTMLKHEFYEAMYPNHHEPATLTDITEKFEE